MQLAVRVQAPDRQRRHRIKARFKMRTTVTTDTPASRRQSLKHNRRRDRLPTVASHNILRRLLGQHRSHKQNLLNYHRRNIRLNLPLLDARTRIPDRQHPQISIANNRRTQVRHQRRLRARPTPAISHLTADSLRRLQLERPILARALSQRQVPRRHYTNIRHSNINTMRIIRIHINRGSRVHLHRLHHQRPIQHKPKRLIRVNIRRRHRPLLPRPGNNSSGPFSHRIRQKVLSVGDYLSASTNNLHIILITRHRQHHNILIHETRA